MRAVLYTQPNCRFCEMAKDFLSSHGIPYVERDVSTDEAAVLELRKLGILAVPVIILEGHVVVGCDIDKLAELIGE